MVTVILNKSGWNETGFSHNLLSLSNMVKNLKWSNQSFQVYPMHIYNEFKLNVIYSMHSVEGIYFCANKGFFMNYLTLDQHVRGCIWRNLSSLEKLIVALSIRQSDSSYYNETV